MRLFQSAPVVADGRCTTAASALLRSARFNPRPSLPTGDAPPRCCSCRSNPVSIRARRCRRAMRYRLQAKALVAAVSIRARRCRRAMRGAATSGRPTNTFQSAPVVADGRCIATTMPALNTATFQSAPVVADGRCGCRSTPGACSSCFNPRPSLPTGDATKVRMSALYGNGFNPRPSLPTGDAFPRLGEVAPDSVSIRARRCRRAMPLVGAHLQRVAVVSIRARRCRRAMHPARCSDDGHIRVSIRARRCRRAMHQARRLGWLTIRFNPRPSLPTGDARKS